MDCLKMVKPLTNGCFIGHSTLRSQLKFNNMMISINEFLIVPSPSSA